jgi:hypothetical protein
MQSYDRLLCLLASDLTFASRYDIRKMPRVDQIMGRSFCVFPLTGDESRVVVSRVLLSLAEFPGWCRGVVLVVRRLSLEHRPNPKR